MPLSPTDNVQPPSSQPTIFVLEDDADVARLICMSLSDYGFRCEHLSTGRQLLARARQSAPDLCIVDPDARWQVSEHTLHSHGKFTPFEGQLLPGRVTHTLVDGRIVFAAEANG